MFREEENKKCPECGEEFIPVNLNHKWCSQECGQHHSKIKSAKAILEEEGLFVQDNNGNDRFKIEVDIWEMSNGEIKGVHNGNKLFSVDGDRLKSEINNYKNAYDNLQKKYDDREDIISTLINEKENFKNQIKIKDRRLLEEHDNVKKTVDKFFKDTVKDKITQGFFIFENKKYLVKEVLPREELLDKGDVISKKGDHYIYSKIMDGFISNFFDEEWHRSSEFDNFLKPFFLSTNINSIRAIKFSHFRYAREKYNQEKRGGKKNTEYRFIPKKIIFKHTEKDNKFFSNGRFPLFSSKTKDKKGI